MEYRVRMMPAMVAIVALATIGDAVGQASNEDSSVAVSWEKARVYVPGRTFAATPNEVNVEEPLPVVIYMHGCTGIDFQHDVKWADYIKGLGFIAVLPDSMARPGRKSNCDPRFKTATGTFPQAYAMRQEEIRYAIEQVRKSPWADSKNVFLMGHSEGGQAAARSRVEGFRGVIISGWTCTHAKLPAFDGIFVPAETPILAMAFDRDVWRVGKPTEGSCASKFGDRANARQLTFSGSEHGTYEQREARDGVAKFLKENLQP